MAIKKKCIVIFLIICAIIGLLVPGCWYHKISVDEYQAIRVSKLYFGTSYINYPQQFLNVKRVDEWLRYNQKQYYSIYFPPTEICFHRIAFTLSFDPDSKYHSFRFSEDENKVFYQDYDTHGVWGYMRELTDIDREFLQFMNQCFEEQEKAIDDTLTPA